jgi:hypothetical protein
MSASEQLHGKVSVRRRGWVDEGPFKMQWLVSLNIRQVLLSARELARDLDSASRSVKWLRNLWRETWSILIGMISLCEGTRLCKPCLDALVVSLRHLLFLSSVGIARYAWAETGVDQDRTTVLYCFDSSPLTAWMSNPHFDIVHHCSMPCVILSKSVEDRIKLGICSNWNDLWALPLFALKIYSAVKHRRERKRGIDCRTVTSFSEFTLPHFLSFLIRKFLGKLRPGFQSFKENYN